MNKQAPIGIPPVILVDRDSHLEIARKCVVAMLTPLTEIRDARSPPLQKEWESGGQRSSGSLGKFLRSREQITWNSIQTDEDGNRYGLTCQLYPTSEGSKTSDPVIKGKVKKMARELSKRHGVSTYQARTILLGKLYEELQERTQ